MLSPHGHVEHAVQLVDDGQATWLSLEPGTAAALAHWLHSMQFMLRVQVDDVSDEWAQLGMCALPPGLPQAGDAPPAWVDPWPHPGADTVATPAFPRPSIPASPDPGARSGCRGPG